MVSTRFLFKKEGRTFPRPRGETIFFLWRKRKNLRVVSRDKEGRTSPHEYGALLGEFQSPQARGNAIKAEEVDEGKKDRERKG